MSSLLTKRPVVLASASPRRLMLLQQVGVTPEVITAEVEEHQQAKPGQTLEELVMANAALKAHAVVKKLTGRDFLIVAADTVVAKDGQIYGKPADKVEAAAMLYSLAGNCHTVYSGLCVIDAKTGRECVDVSETQVWFTNMSKAEIFAYIESGEPMDKAGAYGMQAIGALFVQRIEGDYSTVVGLSLPLLRDMIGRITGEEIHREKQEMASPHRK